MQKSEDGDAKDATEPDMTDVQQKEEIVMPVPRCDPPSCESVLL
jgi:hypothetical protein